MTLAHAILSMVGCLCTGGILGYAFRGRENRMIAHLGTAARAEASKIVTFSDMGKKL